MATTDTRVFKMVWKAGRVRYGALVTVSRLLPRHRYALRDGWVSVFATNEDATDGWVEVTEEFKARYPVG